MPTTRAVAVEQALAGRLVIVQKGVVQDPEASIKGPIRLRAVC